MPFARKKLDEAIRLIQGRVTSRDVAAAALHVRHGSQTVVRSFGAAKSPRAVFLLASISKPMTASAVMILADHGELSLDNPVQKFIPEFQGGERDRVLVRHLLTHTSGLPDMLPDNEELRKRHAPLKDFVAGACKAPLLFSPGTRVSYQSMGALLAAEIVQRIVHRPLSSFLRSDVFEPLGMRDTSLGLGGRKISETMQCQVEHTDWDWNSEYWRNLATPWGGAHSNVVDLDRFIRYFLHPDKPVLKAASVAAMITNQNQGLNQSWGIGWTVGGHGFGKSSSARAFGHGGSTGTLAWLDPEKDLSCVLLTTKPAAQSQRTVLSPVSDLIADAAAS